MSTRRRKRAAPQDLARTCATGDCPDDVRRTYTHTTIADQILKYGSLGVFLGGLGISTGSGTGGRTGYVPLGEPGTPAVRPGPSTNVVRPTVIVDTIGASDIIPIGDPAISIDTPPLDPSAPAVVPLEDLPSSVGNDFNSGVEVVAEVNPAPPETTDSLGAETGVLTTNNSTDSILEVPPTPQPPGRARVSQSTIQNPAFDVMYSSTLTTGESSSSSHIFVTLGRGAHTIGEEIPLIDLTTGSSDSQQLFDPTIETSFTRRTSTPTGRPATTQTSRRLLGRRVQQVQVKESLFLTRPRELVVFENPAFETSDSFEFAPVTGEPLAAPQTDFTDIVKLGRPQYSESAGGRIRVSRLGQRASLKTRSGLRIGPEVHFYHSLSSIGAPEEAIELESFTSHIDHSGSTIVTHADSQSGFEVIELDDLSEPYPDSDLLDEYEDLGHGQLVIGGGRRRQATVTLSNVTIRKAVSALYEDVGAGGITVHYPSEDEPEAKRPAIEPAADDIPLVIIDVLGSGDFLLHPSLLQRRRKRIKSVF
ncbi:minor capsid protein [Sus scrofa papillomavirus 2]|uniref:Minor capsid protein L2 n=1 Tax=Sus scrofa papillomavirus 2 TaxID=2025338 RepID=A0A223FQT8_9PAPI|nr:minor capsid protein [Sus scrofa papillomavirus 2]AST11578.1 minor capsid protein [Sus scrofa papillomavirus 2]